MTRRFHVVSFPTSDILRSAEYPIVNHPDPSLLGVLQDGSLLSMQDEFAPFKDAVEHFRHACFTAA